MVKGISKQVIVVHSPDKKMFDQAIFILSDDAVKDRSVTDDMLLREAKRLIRTPKEQGRRRGWAYGIAYMALGAVLTGSIWVLSFLF